MVKINILTKIFSAIILSAILFIILLFAKGDSNTWVCAAGQWVKSGNPTSPKPPASECN